MLYTLFLPILTHLNPPQHPIHARYHALHTTHYTTQLQVIPHCTVKRVLYEDHEGSVAGADGTRHTRYVRETLIFVFC